MANPPKVSVVLPVLIQEQWQVTMTACCMQLMQDCTGVPFELIVVETGSRSCESLVANFNRRLPEDAPMAHYLYRHNRTTIVKDLNIGLDFSGGELLVHTGNDIFVKPGWLEAMIECFDVMPDCHIATLASSDMRHEPRDAIEEGVYGPLMMFKADYRFDEDYHSIFSDTDLVMQAYENGGRSYRNWRVVVGHLYQQTYQGLYTPAERQAAFEHARQQFFEKHHDCGLVMFKLLYEGHAF